MQGGLFLKEEATQQQRFLARAIGEPLWRSIRPGTRTRPHPGLQRAGLRTPKNLCTRRRDGSVPLRDQETALRVSLRSSLIAVVVAQCPLNLEQSLSTLRARLPLPEDHKSLATYAAMGISIPIRTLELDLHLYTSMFAGVLRPVRVTIEVLSRR